MFTSPLAVFVHFFLEKLQLGDVEWFVQTCSWSPGMYNESNMVNMNIGLCRRKVCLIQLHIKYLNIESTILETVWGAQEGRGVSK